jgi:hypothetical protein
MTLYHILSQGDVNILAVSIIEALRVQYLAISPPVVDSLCNNTRTFPNKV